MLNIANCAASFLLRQIEKRSAFSPNLANNNKQIPDVNIRTVINHSTLIALFSNKNCPTLPETPQNTPAIMANENPFTNLTFIDPNNFLLGCKIGLNYPHFFVRPIPELTISFLRSDLGP